MFPLGLEMLLLMFNAKYYTGVLSKMADRFPLIANSSSNQIQELASGDTLDLTGNNVDNLVNLKTTGITTFSNTTTSEIHIVTGS